MRLFISYARVDKRYCEQIVDLLDIYDVWYDQRLHVGQKWWTEILSQLEGCDGVIYLLSPESIASEYCQRELQIAKTLNKHIFPIIIHPRIEIPENLSEYQFADLSRGLDADAVKALLGAIYLASRQQPVVARGSYDRTVTTSKFVEPGNVSETEMFERIATAFDTEDYDKAVFLLKQFKKSNFSSRFIDLENLLIEAEDALEKQALIRESEREYHPIRILVQHEHTRSLGLQAFRAFQEEFPNFDPDNLQSLLEDSTSLMQNVITSFFQWCEISRGEVVSIHKNGAEMHHHVGAFAISKYPVTNEQFRAFVDAPDGYHQAQWWKFSNDAYQWHIEHPQPLPARFPSNNYPCHNVCWYEAVAFCRWLSHQTDRAISLPSEQEWQRAAQGDDMRDYPWGNEFDTSKCNTKESQLRVLVPSTHYTENISPFGVCDMFGNTWEWCINGYKKRSQGNAEDVIHRAVRGGSFMTPEKRSPITRSHFLAPTYRFTSIGFRLVHHDV